MAGRLSGKVAFVTGGSRGIGATIARRLAAEGAAVALTYAASRDRAEEVVAAISAAGGRAVALRADSADAAQTAGAVDEAARSLGGLDILVNNAGIGVFGPTEGVSLADLDRTLAVNVRAVFVASQAALRHLPEGGRIISVGSVIAERTLGGSAIYAMGKAALAGLTRGLARDLGRRGVLVNLVQPGPIDTELNPESGPHADAMRAMLCLPRFGRTEDIAGMVAFLAGPEAAYITGATFSVDGGFLA